MPNYYFKTARWILKEMGISRHVGITIKPLDIRKPDIDFQVEQIRDNPDVSVTVVMERIG